MTRLEDLPPDLRAALSLLVDRGKSYAEVADLLGIPQSVVRDRAHAALDALAGSPSDNGAAAASSLAAPAEGSSTAASTAALSADSASATTESAGSTSARSASPPPGAGARDGDRTAAGAPEPSPPPAGSARTRALSHAPSALPVSRRGGAALLGGIVVVVVVVVLLITGGGSSSHKTGKSSAGSTASSGSTTGKSPRITKQITLTPRSPSSKAIGIVEVLAEGSQRAFYVAAEKLPPSKGFFYVIWLYNSPSSSVALGRAPNVGSNGRMQGGSLLPSNAGAYHEILLTRETEEHPAHPGPVELSGPFSLGK